MKWVKWAVMETKGHVDQLVKSVTASCAWGFQPFRVGSKPPNKFKRISIEHSLWKSELIYITRSTPLISGAKKQKNKNQNNFQ